MANLTMIGDTPYICVQVLADYNAGRLLFSWIDADQDEDDIWEEIYALLRESKHPNVMVECPDCWEHEGDSCPTCKGTGEVPSAEEWEIADTSAFGALASEVTSIETAVRAAKLITEHGDAAKAAAALFCGLDEIEEALERYQGAWDSEKEYAQENCELEIPDHLVGYIDWAAYARDMNLSSVRLPTGPYGCTELHIFTSEY